MQLDVDRDRGSETGVNGQVLPCLEASLEVRAIQHVMLCPC